MKVVILCGGLGTRLREETEFRPKPMVPIGDRPILWHIMKIYAHYGFTDFILALGYKGEVIKDYFRNYQWNNSDVTLHMDGDAPLFHQKLPEKKWTVTMVDTGLNTQTGGRLKRCSEYLEGEDFLLTYGDGLINSNIQESIEFHNSQKSLVTLTAVHYPSRFGDLGISGHGYVYDFREKSTKKSDFINAGFFVVSHEFLDFIADDSVSLESRLEAIKGNNAISAYKHTGFWQCMDTYREQQLLTEMWNKGNAPWKVW